MSSTQSFNWLKTNSLRMTIADLPNVSFTCQSANLPSIFIPPAIQPTPFIDIPRIGDKVQHSDLSVRFIVQENLANYLEIYNWMVAIGFPNNYDEFLYIKNDRKDRFPFIKDTYDEMTAYSDIHLSVLNSDNNENIRISYRDCYPKELSDLTFDVVSEDAQYQTCTVQFAYRMHDIKVYG